jgi:hypothetical protein
MSARRSEIGFFQRRAIGCARLAQPMRNGVEPAVEYGPVLFTNPDPLHTFQGQQSGDRMGALDCERAPPTGSQGACSELQTVWTPAPCSTLPAIGASASLAVRPMGAGTNDSGLVAGKQVRAFLVKAAILVYSVC